MNPAVKLINASYVVFNVAAAGADNPKFLLVETGRRFVIRSFKFILKIRENISGKPLPWEMNQAIDLLLQIQDPNNVNNTIGGQMVVSVGAGSLVPQLQITKPCILYFENFPFIETVIYQFAINNKGAVAYDLYITLLTEIEYIDIQ
jgi:hypothetical protein